MIWHSLRLRLVAGGIAAILLALAVAGSGLVLLFERHVMRTIADDLNVHLRQLVAGIDSDSAGQITVTTPPAEPRFGNPLSGLYWQIDGSAGQTLRSRSLWDTVLPLPADEPADGEIHQHVMTGPAEARILVVERLLRLSLAGRAARVRVAVAADLARVTAAAAGFTRDLVLALALLGAVLTVATVVQVSLGLQPLAALRRGIAEIRAGRLHHLAPAAPVEVRPLVEEVNALLDAQEHDIERSRGRAADLAHGLKTPLAALSGDAARLRERGQAEIARDIESVAEAMRRHVDRELARARARGAMRRKAGLATELAPLVDQLIGTLARTPAAAHVHFTTAVSEGCTVGIDRADLAEVLGNLLDNAARHARSQVRIGDGTRAGRMAITIEDDGPGIAAAAQLQALARGIRLDEGGEGTGLGLAIVQDVLDAYGWSLTLERSAVLGGLGAVVASSQAD